MKLLCSVFGHKPIGVRPLVMIADAGDFCFSMNIPVFCKWCGCSEIEIFDTKGIERAKTEQFFKLKKQYPNFPRISKQEFADMKNTDIFGRKI